ncbi:hypothetical protein [Winogradskyella sp. PC D3.3]
MKKLILLMFSLLIANSLFSQDQALRITNEVSKKEITIKENKRIKIKTLDGQKISGRFQLEENTIIINNQQYKLSEIGEIKRHPLLVSIVTSVAFIYIGAIATGVAVLVGVLVDTSAFLLTIPAAGMVYTGIKSPNFSRKFKRDNHWVFEIVSIAK